MIRPSNTKPILSFREFLEHGTPEHLCDKSIYEDTSINQNKKKLRDLEGILRNHDFWGSMTDDSRVYRKYREAEDKIHQVIKDVGDEARKLYIKYGKKAGVMESKVSGHSFFPPTPKIKSVNEKHLGKTMIYGKLYKGD